MTNELFVGIRNSGTSTRIDLPAEVNRWLGVEFVKIFKATGRIYIVACDVSEYGSVKAYRSNAGRAIEIGNYVAEGIIPARLVDGKRHAVKKCTFNGRNAVYLNIE